MPGRNGMGPRGEGPMTGGGWGYCGEADVPGPGPRNNSWSGMGRGGGRGFRGGRGSGGGRGFGGGRGSGGGRGPGGERGFGGRNGWRNVYNETGVPGWERGEASSDAPRLSKEDQKQILARQAAMLREQLESIEENLKDLSEPEV